MSSLQLFMTLEFAYLIFNMAIEFSYEMLVLEEYGQLPTYYDNTPKQYTTNFNGYKNEIFVVDIFNSFLIFAQNIDWGTC